MEIFCKQLSKKSHYIFLAQEVNSRGGAGGEGEEGGEKEGCPEGGHLRHRPLGSQRQRRGGAGYKQIHKNKKKFQNFFYKFIQVFTSMRISGTREPLHKAARRQGRKEEEKEFDDAAAAAAFYKSLAKKLEAENGALREMVAAAEARL